VQTEPKNPKLPRPTDPEIRLRLGASPARVLVRYHTRNAYFGDYQSYISKNVLFVQSTEGTPDMHTEMSVHIFLPAGMSVSCTARVVAALPNGFGLSLQLDPDARMTLSQAARF